LWKSRVVITGNPDDQHALDCAFFYLNSSNHPSNLNGMAPFGLSSSRYYLGHSFWDTETWAFLPLLLTSPDTAKSLLLFRRRGLEAAKRVAGLFGYRGAQFPWEAAPIDGEEVTPVFADTGWAEQHIVPDVALAFWQYQMATNDRSFLFEGTWPVISAVAEWIESRGVQTQRGFEILNIMGPDEDSNGLNNSAYVNLACRQALSAAIRCATLAGMPAPAAWQKIVDSMYFPISAAGVLTIAEQSPNNAAGDISYLLPFDCAIDPSVARRTWEAYQSAKSSAPMIAFAKLAVSALAAVMGDRATAGRLFRDSWAPDLLGPFDMTREASPQTHGCFLTNQGSLLRTAMFGFTGIRINEGAWNKYEAALPETWQSIEIERVYIRGAKKRIVARHGKKADIIDVGTASS
jgi:protein-glucosylgalactosylhydroxylysine glucosidase